MDVVHRFLKLKRPEGSTPQVNAIISGVTVLCFTKSRQQPLFLGSPPSVRLSSLHGFHFDLLHLHLLLLHLLLLTSLGRFL